LLMVGKTKTVFGPGSIVSLPALLGLEHADRRLLLVLNASSAGCAWRERLLEGMQGFVLDQWQHPTGSPTSSTVAAIVDRARAHDANLVVAVGGGGVLDAAKAAIARLASTSASEPVVELVAVPTTPGTGAEITPFATIWDFDGGQKTSVSAPSPPSLAVIDPELCVGLPRPILAASVLDALTQGVEASWSIRATPESMRAGLTAVSLIAQAGERLFDPADAGALTTACLAGWWSGQAIAVSQTTACHAISYPLTARYGISHGHACVLSLAPMLSYNAEIVVDDCADPRGVTYVRGAIERIVAAFGERAVDPVCRRVEDLQRLGGLSDYLDCNADSAVVARDAVTYGRLDNNPRLIDEEALLKLLRLLEQRSEKSVPC
jgi:alcohol dehydrogenase class IV